jgi:hypothetical protein
MNWQKTFSLRGINYWLLGSVFGWNLLGNIGLIILSFQVLKLQTSGIQLLQILLMAGSFLVAGLGGYICARISSDGKGPAYGVYGSVSGAVVFLYVLIPSGGILGVIVAGTAVLGGFNGGLLGMRIGR